MDFALLGFKDKAARDSAFLTLQATNVILPDLLKLLKPFYDATQELSASLKVTASLVRLRISQILTVVEDNSVPAQLTTLAGNLAGNLRKRFKTVLERLERPLLLCEFFDRRTCKDLFVADPDDPDGKQVSTDTNELLQVIDNALSQDLPPSAPVNSAAARGIDLGGPVDIDPLAATLKQNIMAYFLWAIDNPLPMDACPLREDWLNPDSPVAAWPLLRHLAKQYLCIQASEADSERVASWGSVVQTARRRHMQGIKTCMAVVLGAAARAGTVHRTKARSALHDIDKATQALQNKPPTVGLGGAAAGLPAAAGLAAAAAVGAGAAAPPVVAPDDDDDCGQILRIGPPPLAPGATKKDPVEVLDEGDLDYLCLEAGIAPDEDGSINYVAAAAMMLEEEDADEFVSGKQEADADKEDQLLREVVKAAKRKASKKKAPPAAAAAAAAVTVDPEELIEAHIQEAKVVAKPVRRSARQQTAFQRLQTLST
jgi:hypothetical protein